METEKKPRKPRAKKVVETVKENIHVPETVNEPVKEKKKIGRPKKNAVPETVEPVSEPIYTTIVEEVPKKKGRPKKVKSEPNISLSIQETTQCSEEPTPTIKDFLKPEDVKPEVVTPDNKNPEDITPDNKKTDNKKPEDKKKADDDDEEPTIEDYRTLLTHYINRYAELQRKMSKLATQVDVLVEESYENIYKFFMDCRSLVRTAKRYCMDPPDIYDILCLCDGNDIVASTAKDFKEVMEPVRPQLFQHSNPTN